LRAHAFELHRADIRVQHEHGDQEPEVADAVHDERLLSGVRVRLIEIPESDEQIRAETHPFPPDEHHWIARAHHEHEHEGDEQVEIREVPGVPSIVPHVAHAKNVDQHPDAGDDEDHHHRELIELKRRIDVEIAD